MSLKEKLGAIRARHEELASLMSTPNLGGDKFVKYSQEYSALGPVVEAASEYEKALKEKEDLNEMLDDPEMRDIASGEMREINKLIPELEQKLKLSLIPKDEARRQKRRPGNPRGNRQTGGLALRRRSLHHVQGLRRDYGLEIRSVRGFRNRHGRLQQDYFTSNRS